MDLMRDFVRDRTIDLQRLAEDVRREHDLRQIETTVVEPVAALRLEAVTMSDGDCDAAECVPATVARHAA
jgi:hypothetical protein